MSASPFCTSKPTPFCEVLLRREQYIQKGENEKSSKIKNNKMGKERKNGKTLQGANTE